MSNLQAVYEWHSESSHLDVYFGSTYTPTMDVLCAMTGSKNLRAPHDWPEVTAHAPLWSYSPEFDQ